MLEKKCTLHRGEIYALFRRLKRPAVFATATLNLTDFRRGNFSFPSLNIRPVQLLPRFNPPAALTWLVTPPAILLKPVQFRASLDTHFALRSPAPFNLVTHARALNSQTVKLYFDTFSAATSIDHISVPTNDK